MEYEQYHFISKPSKERHIEKMSCIAKLLGVDVSPFEGANVLELGTGTGDNLISMAISYPNAYFFGIDKSKSQIARGNKNIKELGIKNISLIESDFSKFKSKIKKFDYIIMHGVFSWVNDKSRNGALKIIKKYLKENGVCFISFNSNPGSIFREILIKIILKIDNKNLSLPERVKNVRGELDKLYEYLQDGNSNYALGLRTEVENIKNLTDSFIVNEILNPEYKSFTLEEFIKEINKHKLYYLSDTSFIRGFSENRSEENLNTNFEKFESYVDYIFPKITRGVLVTSKKITRKINLDVIDNFFVSSSLCCTGESNGVAEFTTSNGQVFELEDKKEIEFFKMLEQSWPKPILLKEMNCILRKRKVIDYFSKEFVDFYITDLAFNNVIKDKPNVSPFAKIQLKTQDYATNFRNEYVIFNEFQKQVFMLLDGNKTKSDIVNILVEKLKKDGKFEENVFFDLQKEIDNTLEFFRETAYLL